LGESNIPSVAADVYHRAVQTELLKGRTVLAICCACIYKACAEQAGE
jgi:transcription initiation factor TFIIIB Brf1 subunit/transcription initiation factor TFIIB